MKPWYVPPWKCPYCGKELRYWDSFLHHRCPERKTIQGDKQRGKYRIKRGE